MTSVRTASRQREVRRLMAAAAAAAVLCTLIALSYGYAGHQPQPRDVRIAIAAPPRIRQLVAAGLRAAAPGGFTIIAVTPNAALRAVRHQDAEGALVVSGETSPEIVTAGAAGVSQQQSIRAALGALVPHLGGSADQIDVAPLPAGDRGGQSSFVFELALLIPSVLGAVGLAIAGVHLRLWWRVAAAAGYAVLASLAGVLSLDAVLGALTGAPAATFGFGVLGALTCILFTIACQAAFGLPGTGIAALVFLFVGNAMSGGTIPVRFLPIAFRQISEWLPNFAIVQVTRSANYFHSAAVGHSLVVLTIWLGCALLAIAAVDRLQRTTIADPGLPAREAYGASALSLLVRRRSARISEVSR